MPLLVSRAMFEQSRTVPSAAKTFTVRRRVKCGSRHTCTAGRTPSGTVTAHTDTGAPVHHLYTVFICHTKLNYCRLVINELLNMSEPPGAIAERVQV